MDADLSTNLNYLPELIKAIEIEGYDISIGSRLSKNSIVRIRSFLREFLSKSYNILIKLMFFTSFNDSQCGFKALNKNLVKNVLPIVRDNNWFFDTELLIIAEKMGYKIKQIPVRWIDYTSSKVKILKTIIDDLKGLLRLRIVMPWKFK